MLWDAIQSSHLIDLIEVTAVFGSFRKGAREDPYDVLPSGEMGYVSTKPLRPNIAASHRL